MPNTFSDDPRRIAYDRNLTQKRALEKWSLTALLLLLVIGSVTGLIIGFFAILRFLGGDASLMPMFLLLLAGTVFGVLSVLRKNNALAIVSAMCFAGVAVASRDIYYLVFSGGMAGVFVLNRQWEALAQEEGYPDFNFAAVEQRDREVLEHGAIAAITGAPVVADLTARRLPSPEPVDSDAAQKPFNPGEMDSI